MEDLCKEFIEFVNILKKVRNECPWDRKQTPKSLVQYFMEESYELVEAIENENEEGIKEELGDVLIHIVMQSIMAEERKSFNLEDVLRNVSNKLILRHPHVFGNTKLENEEEVLLNWESIKKEEKENSKGILDGIPKILPSLLASLRIQEKVSHVGFDWKNAEEILPKLREELLELENAIKEGDKENIREEIGDLLFTIVNLSRHLDVNPETALKETNEKFIERFRFIEEKVKEENKRWEELTLEDMDKWWEISKTAQKGGEKE
ncbi:MAG: nucleoside triphosphate pyrophosphohydrolase [Dictyoglomus sp. NZ13-RE01]|nr:MAG: nucleoside triphosphate pyrophosphohydrolase [Dictyoglomus sp. NZ13-RE01]